MKQLLLILSAITLAITSFTTPVSAVSTAEFNAGNIIDDIVFTNKAAMTTSQIQAFLNSKVPTCDTNGQQLSEYGGPDLNGDGKVQRWEWGKSRYNQTTFPCLRNYKEDGKTSAQIIYDVAQKYSINPQTLIVLLQKEQGLVTDTWPLTIQYKTATGYGCPDTAPCDTQYYGLTNQLDWAAKMFRSILNNSPGWYTPYVLGNNYIQYSPNSSCGGSTVKIQNRSTQALYNYTPYQPNKGALNAGWGTAPCGAYGNRNFYLYFTQWFGSVRDKYTYRFERLVGTTSAVQTASSNNLGDYTKTLVQGDNIYVFYYDATTKTLRYSLWNGSKWSNHLLDGAGATTPGAVARDVGKGIDAVVWNKQIQVYYYDATSGALRHAWLNAGKWRTETMEGNQNALHQNTANVGQSPKALLYKGQLQLYYYNQTNGSVRHAWWSEGRWKFETLDGASNSISKSNVNVGQEIEALVYNGNLQLYYYNQTNGSVRHAWWSEGRWKFETMDGATNSLGKSTNDMGAYISATLYNGQLQLYYKDRTTGELKHAWWTNNEWRFEVMDGNANSVLKNVVNAGDKVVAKQFGKDLFIFYFDKFNDAWRAAYWSNGGWHGYNLDGGTNSKSGSSAAVGGQLSVDVHKGNSLQIYYKDASGSLGHAWINGR